MVELKCFSSASVSFEVSNRKVVRDAGVIVELVNIIANQSLKDLHVSCLRVVANLCEDFETLQVQSRICEIQLMEKYLLLIGHYLLALNSSSAYFKAQTYLKDSLSIKRIDYQTFLSGNLHFTQFLLLI